MAHMSAPRKVFSARLEASNGDMNPVEGIFYIPTHYSEAKNTSYI